MSPPRVVALALFALAATASAAPPPGENVYRQKCANCHGAHGQGVADKYAEPLIGDWSVAKLARYIGRNMPEDEPETLTAEEAGAVAAFIHDAFYSRAAQARNHPARIQLSHLTSRQYAVTVADLLRQFGEPDGPSVEGRGLSASYYRGAQRGRFDAGRLLRTVTEPQVEIEFVEGSPGFAVVGGTEFSVQWRGTVFAEETGDYEFTVRTPNSVRLWVNAELYPASPADAIIDVNVSTPETPDHRATVRLIGGRSYPIGIDYWALPGKAGSPLPSISLRWKPPHGSERQIPARNLSPAKIAPTFVTTTRFPADDSSHGYERSGAVSKGWDDATTRAAFEVANYVSKRLDRLAGVNRGDSARAAKVAAFAERFVAAAFRRPLSAEEKQRFVTERLGDGADLDTAIKRVVLLALKAPQFLYVDVPAGATVDARTAARLSFGLWDSLPDVELAQAAEAGKLRTRLEVAAHAERMLADPRARAKLREFFHHWLQMRFVEDLDKDPALYPDFTHELIDDLRLSLNLFLDEVAWGERSDFRDLLRADFAVANARVAEFYGWPKPAGGDFARVSTAEAQRAGVLTHPYLLSALAYKNSSSPIHRGVFLTRAIVGRALKSPPEAQAFNEQEFDASMTMREKIAKLTRSDACQGCHSVINPLGFSLEWYDAVGRFRTTEKGRPIDAASDYLSDEHETVRLAGPRDVAEFAIRSQRANDAFIEQLFHHVAKQAVMAYGHETADKLRESFIASGYNLRKLLAEIATVAAMRGVEPQPANLTHISPLKFEASVP